MYNMNRAYICIDKCLVDKIVFSLSFYQVINLADEVNIFLFVILVNEHEQEIILEMVNISIILFASILYFPIVTLSQQSSLAAI